MFVFAIWDRQTETLFIARDRMGEKPIFLVPYEGENFNKGLIFSSELKALLTHTKVKINFDNNAIWEYLSLNYVLTSSCIIKNVKKLEPGCFGFFSKKENFVKKYWELKKYFINKRNPNSLNNTMDDFNSLLSNTLQKQINSDVPLGAFLSGGVDSSIVVSAIIATEKKIETFCIGFDEYDYNEISKSVCFISI